MTQTELSKTSGKSQQFISMVLSGDRRPNYSTAKAWESITGIPLAAWMEAEPDVLRLALDGALAGAAAS